MSLLWLVHCTMLYNWAALLCGHCGCLSVPGSCPTLGGCALLSSQGSYPCSLMHGTMADQIPGHGVCWFHEVWRLAQGRANE